FQQTFTDLDVRVLAISVIDGLYVQICKMDRLDKFTNAYVDVFVRTLMTFLTKNKMLGFYILDNSIRDDRFRVTLDLFRLAGFECIHPYSAKNFEYSDNYTRHSVRDFKEVENQIDQAAQNLRHILYVEKDDSVNYLKEVMWIADEFQSK